LLQEAGSKGALVRIIGEKAREQNAGTRKKKRKEIKEIIEIE
jgi:hypothetical protein